jgi:hypothetical protein
MTHWLAGAQSAADWHGKAHFPYCVLQRWSPQVTSVWQGSASSPGVAIDDAGAGAGAGAVAGGIGAGVGGGAYVAGGGAVYAGAGPCGGYGEDCGPYGCWVG